MLKTRRGQSVLEYVILIVIVIAALLTLQTYIKRGIQGRLKSATDDIGEQFTTNSNYSFNKTVKSRTRSSEYSNAGATTTNTISSTTNTTRNATGLQNSTESWN